MRSIFIKISVVILILSNLLFADTFLDNCIKQYEDMSENLKSYSSNIEITTSAMGNVQKQKSKIYYKKKGGEVYTKTSLKLFEKNVTMVSKGDELCMKSNTGPWKCTKDKENKNSGNPIKGYSLLMDESLKYIGEDATYKKYEYEDETGPGVMYINKDSHLIEKQVMTIQGKEALVLISFVEKNGVVFPFRTEVSIDNGSIKTVTEYKNLTLNMKMSDRIFLCK